MGWVEVSGVKREKRKKEARGIRLEACARTGTIFQIFGGSTEYECIDVECTAAIYLKRLPSDP